MQLGATAITGTTEALGASSSWTFEVTERDIRRFLQAIGDSSTDPDPDPDPQGLDRPPGTRPWPFQLPLVLPELRVLPTPMQIFMFSAITWNRHHIHYSADAARAEGVLCIQAAF